MKNEVTNVMFVGIGGQGIIRASDILSEAAFRHQLNVKKSELHGMSQRGGSVSSDVRFGKTVYSPMIPQGEVDYLIATEEDQIEVARPYLNEKTVIIAPTDLSEDDAKSRMANIVMLGILNRHLQFSLDIWDAIIHENFPGAVGDANMEAFKRGMGC